MNLLSLDIVFGAIFSALYFSDLLEVHILPYGLIALGLTVWIVYTADHLKDAFTIKHTAASDRHRYHQEHFKPLFIAMVIAITMDCIIILFMREPVLKWGIVLAVIVCLYLLVHRYLKILKELFVAALYTLGVLLPSISVSRKIISEPELLIFVMFGISAWVNLLLFSWFDRNDDENDDQQSFTTLSGERFTYFTIVGLTIFNIVLFIVILLLERLVVPAIIPIMMTLTLCGLMFIHHSAGKYFRILGDAVFYLPGFYWLWHQI